jgi:hypothetical protein
MARITGRIFRQTVCNAAVATASTMAIIAGAVLANPSEART